LLQWIVCFAMARIIELFVTHERHFVEVSSQMLCGCDQGSEKRVIVTRI
jgi:hypothetical protein